MVPQALKGLKVQVPQGPQCTKTGVSRASKWYLKGLSAPKLVSQGSQSAGASRACLLRSHFKSKILYRRVVPDFENRKNISAHNDQAKACLPRSHFKREASSPKLHIEG